METEQTQRRMLVVRELPIHTYDVDFMQIVNNTVYVKWMEDLRMAIMDEHLPLTETLKDGCSPILAETHVLYKYPITFGTKPIGYAWMADMQKSRWTIEFEIREGDRIYATGKQTGYYYDLKSKRPTRWPKELLEKYESITTENQEFPHGTTTP